MSLGHVNVSAPVTYGMTNDDIAQRNPGAIATVALYGPRGGFLGAEEIDVDRARAAHQSLGALIAKHDARAMNGEA